MLRILFCIIYLNKCCLQWMCENIVYIVEIVIFFLGNFSKKEKKTEVIWLQRQKMMCNSFLIALKFVCLLFYVKSVLHGNHAVCERDSLNGCDLDLIAKVICNVCDIFQFDRLLLLYLYWTWMMGIYFTLGRIWGIWLYIKSYNFNSSSHL